MQGKPKSVGSKGRGSTNPSTMLLFYRQQRSPSQPAMCSACEVSGCSVLTNINAPRGCAPIQPSTARLGHQIRCIIMCFVRMVGSSTGSRLDRSSWCCVVASVARLMPGPVIELTVTLKASPRDGTTPSLPHMRYSVRKRRTP